MRRCLPFSHKYSKWLMVHGSHKEIWLPIPETRMVATYEETEEKVCQLCGKRKIRKVIG